MSRAAGVCSYCKLIAEPDRRFYMDNEGSPFVIIESPNTDTPILVARQHLIALPSIAHAVAAFKAMNMLCERVMGYAYCLTPETCRGHFVIRSRTIHCSPFRVPSCGEPMAESGSRSCNMGGSSIAFPTDQAFNTLLEGLFL